MNLDRNATLLQLNHLLAHYNVSTASWGTGAAKEIDDLMAEIAAGETVLEPINGVLYRKVSVLYVDVRYGTMQLYEDRQEFFDGRVRRRTLVGSLAEKLHGGEQRDHAVYRAIEEELGIPHTGVAWVEHGDSWTETTEAPSYPTLRAQFTNYKAVAHITSDWYREEGYVEVQPKKRTFFVWR